MSRYYRRRDKDPYITMINIIFLILIFFMVAGSLTTPHHESISLAVTENVPCCSQPDGIILLKDTRLFIGDKAFGSVSQPNELLMEELEVQGVSPVRIIPDKDLPAKQLLTFVAYMKENGVGDISILTQIAVAP